MIGELSNDECEFWEECEEYPGVWNLNDKHKEVQIIQKVMLNSPEITATKITMQNNTHPQIISILANPKFMHLRQLSLSGNMINSVEMLPQLQAPSLNILDLDDNCIINLQALRRVCWLKELYLLILDNNFLREGSPIMQMPYQSILRQISLESSNYNPCFEDISWVSKLQNPSFKLLWVCRYDRIPLNSKFTHCVSNKMKDSKLKVSSLNHMEKLNPYS